MKSLQNFHGKSIFLLIAFFFLKKKKAYMNGRVRERERLREILLQMFQSPNDHHNQIYARFKPVPGTPSIFCTWQTEFHLGHVLPAHISRKVDQKCSTWNLNWCLYGMLVLQANGWMYFSTMQAGPLIIFFHKYFEIPSYTYQNSLTVFKNSKSWF